MKDVDALNALRKEAETNNEVFNALVEKGFYSATEEGKAAFLSHINAPVKYFPIAHPLAGAATFPCLTDEQLRAVRMYESYHK